MRFSFGESIVDGGGGNGGNGGTGDSQIFPFVDNDDSPVVISSEEDVVIPVVVTSFGDGTIGFLRFSVYITIPDLADLSLRLVHPAFHPNIAAPGMAGFHVLNYVVDSHNTASHLAGVVDLGESEDQPIRFVWDVAIPSITDYEQDEFGDFRPGDDISTLYGLPMAGTWELHLYDYNGPREGVAVHYAALEIFDDSPTLPAEPATPVPSFTMDSVDLEISMDASATTGGEAPLKYFWEIYDDDDNIVGSANGGIPSSSPLATFDVPIAGEYQVSLRVTSDTNFAKEYLLQEITVGGTPPPETTNSVYSLNRKLWNTEDDTLLGPGINIHTMGFSFPQVYFDKLASEGVKWCRLLCHPNSIETAPGVYNTTAINHVKTSAARASTAGIKVLLCLCINSPQWDRSGNPGGEAEARFPAHWLNNGGVNPTGPATPVGEFSTASLFDVFRSHGEDYTRYMMQEFLADTNVWGVDLVNEPDVHSAAKVQRGTNDMLTWLREEDDGAGKLFVVGTNRYSSQSAATADNDWDAITDYTNVVLQLHTYFAPQVNNDDGWDGSTGVRDSSDKYWNSTDNVGSPNATSYVTANKASFGLQFASWEAESVARDVPYILGEIGVRHDQVGTNEAMRIVWANDARDEAEEANCATLAIWIASEEFEQDDWGSHDGAAIRPEYAALLLFTPLP